MVKSADKPTQIPAEYLREQALVEEAARLQDLNKLQREGPPVKKK